MQSEESKLIPVESEDSLRSKGWKLRGLTQNTHSGQVQVNKVQSVDNMIMRALDSGRSMDDIQKLIDMRNAELARIADLEFIEAKKEFQKACPMITKNHKTSFDHKDGQGKTEYWYAELQHVESVVKGPLADNGFTYDWEPSYEGTDIVVELILSHVGGHKKRVKMKGPADTSGKKNFIQANSSTVSYLQRYTLLAGIGKTTGGQDDDGRNAAADEPKVKRLEHLSSQRFNDLLQAYRKGSVSMADVQERYRLTDDQQKALETIKPTENNGLS